MDFEFDAFKPRLFHEPLEDEQNDPVDDEDEESERQYHERESQDFQDGADHEIQQSEHNSSDEEEPVAPLRLHPCLFGFRSSYFFFYRIALILGARSRYACILIGDEEGDRKEDECIE